MSQASVVTRMRLPLSPAEVWARLMFYEEILEPPGLLVRWLLPRPIRTEGRKSEVGDEARCLYQSGHLIKRITAVDRNRHYGFEVIEQELRLGGLRLSGGSYTVGDQLDGQTEVALETCYASPRRPRWLWSPIESALCHAFHRHILKAMGRAPAGRPQPSGT